jgi:hypothetical protein
MEIHHHAHTEGKKWTHYLWEFLMLFLAVFCGFLAENQREHLVENRREKQYIRSLVQDLERDVANYNSTIELRHEREKQAVQLVDLLYSPDRNKHLNEIYFYARQMPRLDVLFYPTTATMNQLKNSGALRLIKKTSITDSIVAYNTETEAHVQRHASEMETRNYLRQEMGNIFDASVLMSMMDTSAKNFDQVVIRPVITKPLMTQDQLIINHFCTIIHFIYSTSVIIRKNLMSLKKQAERLIETLKKEYHLE